jgi:hypothetical protein
MFVIPFLASLQAVVAPNPFNRYPSRVANQYSTTAELDNLTTKAQIF